jgi:hypothetical protein
MYICWIKKLLFILLCLPMIGFGQDLKPVSSSDLIINHLFKKTIPFIKDRNSPKPDFRFYLEKKESLINWDDQQFSKWKISEKQQHTLKK